MPVRRTNAKEIFLEALEKCVPDQWPAFLDQVCRGDDQLRQRVEALLEVHGEPNRVLDDLPRLAAPFAEGPGTSIAQYKLLEEIGEGGFGIVYLAEQSEPIRRRVALKIIKPGMDTKQVIARFEAERQALALMDHPNIAKVLDAGKTESGRPYFVMQLVNGVPITEYCDRCNLSSRERLTLFVSVCHAVQHAHQKGIIHRDIKPSNVLIAMRDGRPAPRIIDFGVAKAINQRLTEQTLVTGFAQMLGTPLYMSPEQAELRPLEVDTRTDIYSLGVLLYELLTGTTPFEQETMQGASYDEIRRILREEEPPKPSVRISTLNADARTTVSARRCTDPHQLKLTVRGDLDWIAMKALEKDRTRRYDTANGLALDVERFLNEEPVLACPPSALYRLRKFARRNKVLLTTFILLASVMFVGTVVSIALAILEGRAREVAEMERASAAKQRDRAVRAEKQLDATVYAQKIALAHHELQAGHVDRARQLLAVCPPKYRHWEWHYLQRLCNSELLSICAWTPYVFSSVAFSPDGERVAAGVGYWARTGGKVNIYDAESGRKLRELRSHLLWSIEDIAFSRDGRRIASVSGFYDKNRKRTVAGEVKVWDALTGDAPLFEFEGSIHSAAFSSDGRKLAWVTTNKTIVVWNLDADQKLLELPTDSIVHSLDLSLDDQYIAAACDDETIRIWDATTGKMVQTLIGHTGPVMCVSFGPDSGQLASGSEDATARVWNVKSGRSQVTFTRHLGRVLSIGFSPDGRRVASAGGEDHLLWSWDASTGDDAVAFRGHGGVTSDSAYSSVGSRLVSCDGGSLKIWDTAYNPQVKPLARHRWWINAVAISPDGQLVASGANDSTAMVSDAATGELISVFDRHGGNVRNVLFTPDGQHVVSSGSEGTVRIWNARTTQEILRFDGHRGTSVKGLAPSPNDVHVATGDDNGMIIVWEWATGREVQRFTAQGHQIWSVDFSSDGQRIATAGADGAAKIWSVNTGELLLTLGHHAGTLRCVRFSPDGRLYAASHSDRIIRIWDASTGEEIHTLEHGTEVYAFSLSQDGRRLVAACGEGVLRVWDTESFEDLLRLPGSLENYHHAAFSSDGRLLAAGGDDRTVRVWDGTPLPAEQFQKPLASDLVVRLFKGLQLKEAVFEELIRISSLDDDLRRIALDIAREIDEDAVSLNQASWYVVKRTNGDAGAYRLAARQAERACNLSPENWAYLNTLGIAYYRSRQYQLAIDTLEKATRANPEGGNAFDWFFLGMSWYKLDDPVKARHSYDKSVQWWKRRETLNAGEAQELASFWTEAVNLLGVDTDRDRFDPQQSLALRHQGEYAIQQERWQEAADRFGAALEVGWPDRSLWTLLACAQLLAKDDQGYQDFCRQLLKEHGNGNPSTQEQIALVGKLGVNAVEDVDQLVLMSEELAVAFPQSARIRNHLAGILYRASRYEEALEQLEQNLMVRDSVWDWLWLAMIHARLEHSAEATKWLDMARSSHGSSANLQLRLLFSEAEALVDERNVAHDTARSRGS